MSFRVASTDYALYTPGLGEQSGVLKDSSTEVYLGYRNIDEIIKLLKKKMNYSESTLYTPRPGV